MISFFARDINAKEIYMQSNLLEIMEEGQEMTINYETVYELLRREKSREEMQKLPENFVEELAKYVQWLGTEVNKKKRDIDSFSSDEIRREEQKYYNMRRVISELYEKRERKIINMAITKSRTNAKLADVANLLDTEKELFNSLVETLNLYRKKSMEEMLGKKKKEQEGKTQENNPQGKRMVRFLSAVPKFYDKEMNVLGPFEPDEIASLPPEITDILIKKGRAEEINGAD
ncbi:MAG: hypothetical protein ACOCZ6_04395 [Nanoarchaeota archaeon]